MPREIQHVSYSTAQMSHDLNILHSKMAHSKSSGKLIAELPAVHALMAQLKEEKDGTTERRRGTYKIKGHLHLARLATSRTEEQKMSRWPMPSSTTPMPYPRPLNQNRIKIGKTKLVFVTREVILFQT